MGDRKEKGKEGGIPDEEGVALCNLPDCETRGLKTVEIREDERIANQPVFLLLLLLLLLAKFASAD